ncbi:hypothetical protein ACP70R_037995 [Stipagrostis hirtigluma subsp. patula]
MPSTAAADPDAVLARLSGPELVAHLRTTCSRADYDAAERVLGARDRRLAAAEAKLGEVMDGLQAALAEVGALREKYEALRGARDGPAGSEAARPAGAIASPAPAPLGERRAEGAEDKLQSPGAEVSGGFACKRETSPPASSDDDEDDTIPLSQLVKKRRGAESGAGEPKKAMGGLQSNSVGSLGTDLQRNSLVISEGHGAAAGQRVDEPEEPKSGAMSRAMPCPSPTGSAVRSGKSGEDGAMPCSSPTGSAGRGSFQMNSSKVDDGGARTGGNQGSFACSGKVTPTQVRAPSLTVSKCVQSVKENPEAHKGQTGCSPVENGSVVSRAIREKTSSRGHRAKKLAQTDRIGAPKHAELCESKTESLFEPGPSCTPLKGLILPSSSCKSTSISAEKETSILPSSVTRHWKSVNAIFTSCLENKEISLLAVCALYRRRIANEPREGGQRGNFGLSKAETHRLAKLVDFLLDGNLQGPLKRAAEELVKHDPTGPTFLEGVLLGCMQQLFDIYKNKEDPYFC